MISLSLLILMLEAIGATFLRLWILMFVSILIAIAAGIVAARVRTAELIIIPITDVLESVPVISFFPIVLVFFVVDIGGPIGIDLAVDFLIITALVWNIIIGVYQAVSHIPQEYVDSTFAFKMSILKKVRHLYIPASIQKIVANIMPSFASGLFYITLSEVISLGPHNFHVFGIGNVAIKLADSGNVTGTVILILLLVVAIFLNFFFIINPLVRYSEKFTFESERAQGETSLHRKRSVIFTSMSQRTSQMVSSIAQMVSSVGKIASYAPSKRLKRKVKLSAKGVNFVVGIVLVFILIVSIYVIAQSGFSKAFVVYFINPSFLYLASVGTLYDLLRIVIVYAASLLTMVPLAIIGGRRGKGGNLVNGSMQVLYSIPAPIFYPLILIYLTPFLMEGVNYEIAINIDVLIIAYLSAASYIFFNVFIATRSIPSELTMVADSFKFKRMARIKYVIFPSIAPALITGSMAAMGSYWAGLMVGEYASLPNHVYSVSYGLMKMIDEAIASGNLLYADAIDIYMVIIIIVVSYLIWIRLYDYSRRRFTLV